MQAKEVKGKVREILEQGKGIEIYFVLKKENGRIVKSVNISDEELEQSDATSDEMLQGFCDVVATTFESYDDEIEVLKLSSADERKNGLYYYDLDELPEEMIMMGEVIAKNAESETFNFSNDSLEEIVAFITVIGNAEKKIVLY